MEKTTSPRPAKLAYWSHPLGRACREAPQMEEGEAEQRQRTSSRPYLCLLLVLLLVSNMATFVLTSRVYDNRKVSGPMPVAGYHMSTFRHINVSCCL